MDTEILATAAVKTSISTTDVLSPFINDKDKEPTWDGNIYIHTSSKKNKDGVKRVPVQVKGEENKDLSKQSIRYGIETADLKNYLNDGGVMFFVVRIDSSGTKNRIYYAALLPIKLRQILQQAEGKKKTYVEFRPFPDNNNEKVSVMLTFFENMKRQSSFSHAKLPSLEELEKKGILEGVSVTVTGYGDRRVDPKEWFFLNDVYMYANVSGMTIPQPLEGVITNMHMMEDVQEQVSIKGTVYYESFKRIRYKDGAEVHVGKSFQIISHKDKKEITYRIMPTSILDYAVEDLSFLLALAEQEELTIGTATFPIMREGLFTEEHIKWLQNNYEYCKKASKLFDNLNLEKMIDLSDLTDEDAIQMQRLMRGLIDRQPVLIMDSNLPPIAKISLNGDKILIGFEKTRRENLYLLHDFMRTPIVLYVNNEKGEKCPTSKFYLLNADDFLEVKNINYEELIQSYWEFNESYMFPMANLTLLELLKAFDKSRDTRIDLLDVAEKLAEKLNDSSIEEAVLEKSIRQINMIQTYKRRRKLSEKENKILNAIASGVDQRDDIRCAACLLMEKQDEAKVFYERMLDEEKNLFKTYPIFRYWI